MDRDSLRIASIATARAAAAVASLCEQYGAAEAARVEDGEIERSSFVVAQLELAAVGRVLREQRMRQRRRS
jgi:hypothetical protein